MIDMLLAGATIALAHVTYYAIPHDQRPQYVKATITIVTWTLGHGRRLALITVRQARHHGRWLVWQVCAILPMREARPVTVASDQTGERGDHD